MVRDEAGAPAGPGRGDSGPRAERRKLPLGRAATLIVGTRTHIVGLSDLSVTGAYLITSLAAAVGDEHVLQLFALPGQSGLSLRVRVVRVVRREEHEHHPGGLAVEFLSVDAAGRARIESFVRGGGLRR